MILHIKKNSIGNKKDLNIRYRKNNFRRNNVLKNLSKVKRKLIFNKKKPHKVILARIKKYLFNAPKVKKKQFLSFLKVKRYRVILRFTEKKQRKAIRKYGRYGRFKKFNKFHKFNKYNKFNRFNKFRFNKFPKFKKFKIKKAIKSNKPRKALFRAFKVPKADHPKITSYTKRVNALLSQYENKGKLILSSMLVKKGLRQKAEKFVQYLLESYKKDNRGHNMDFMFNRSFHRLEIYIRFLLKRVGSQKHKIPVYLAAKQGFYMGIRELANSANKLSKSTNILQNLVTETFKSKNKKSNAFIRRKNTHMQALDNRIYLKYLRKAR